MNLYYNNSLHNYVQMNVQREDTQNCSFLTTFQVQNIEEKS